MISKLSELSRNTGLKVRPLDLLAVEKLFDELERYDSNERAETFNYLKRALNETRASLKMIRAEQIDVNMDNEASRKTSRSDTQIRHCMHGMQRMHAHFCRVIL
jgi:hypothetical protein